MKKTISTFNPRLTQAKRLTLFTESIIREQTRLAMQYGAINLAQGFPDFACPPELKRLASQALREDYNQYSVTWGMPALREAIAAKAAAYNHLKVDPDRNITVTCGATEGMIAAFLALVNPGKEVILFQPFYENYHPDAYLSGAKPRYVTLNPPKSNGDWTFDPDEFKRAFNSKTAAVIMTSPHNPTGKVFTRSELKLIAEQCEKWGALVFSDEIYEHILYEGAVHISPASIPGLEDKTVTLNSASKTYGVTGWRVGWVIAPAPLTQSIRQVHDFLTVCAATPLQKAVTGALRLGPSYYQELARHYQQKRDQLMKGLRAIGFEVVPPKGAYYLMANIEAFVGQGRFRNDAEMAARLVADAKVACVPGYSFYRKAGKEIPHLRFCFCKKRQTLREATTRLKAYLKTSGK